MRTGRRLGGAALLSIAVGVLGGSALAEPDGAPTARALVRRKTDLGDALRTAIATGAAFGEKSAVAIVVDATAATLAAKDQIATAIRSLDSLTSKPASWQIGTLGQPLGKPVASPADLAASVEATLAKPSKTVNTFADLRRSLKSFAGEGGAVVYVADRHFEDDWDLERFVADQKHAGRTFSALGGEAGFGRPWVDGVMVIWEKSMSQILSGDLKRTRDGIGRNPFGAGDAAAPWHGGDTAYPHQPYEYPSWYWETTFQADLVAARRSLRASKEKAEAEEKKAKESPAPGAGPAKAGSRAPDPKQDPDGFYAWAKTVVTPPDREKDPEAYAKWLTVVGVPPPESEGAAAYAEWLDDFKAYSSPLAKPTAPSSDPSEGPEPLPRLPKDLDELLRESPLPSSFGPYGLTRAAQETGGRYVVWSWDRSKPSLVEYDYSRCDLFEPDLRARSEILKEVTRRPLALALLKAWEVLAARKGTLVCHTPPFKGTTPAEIQPIDDFDRAHSSWQDRGDRDEAIKAWKRMIDAIDRATAPVDAAAQAAGEPKDAADRRYLAEAHLMLHALATVRFELGEAAALAATVVDADFQRKNHYPGIQPVFWIEAADDKDPVETTHARLQDAAAGERLLAARKAHVERYRGTPFGAMVAMNHVQTYELGWYEKGGVDAPATVIQPSASGGKPPAPTPPSGGSSSGGGPTTGGK